MTDSWRGGIVATLLCVLTCSSHRACSAEGVDLQRTAASIVDRTNQLRGKNQLDPLEVDSDLEKAAQDFADFMARTDKYGHQADGQTPWERAAEAGYDYCAVRENIAYRTDPGDVSSDGLASEFYQGWYESSEHRDNMLAKQVTETAVALSSKDGLTFYAVQLFGRPESMMFQVRIKNLTDSSWTLRSESVSGKDEIDLPPKNELRMKRCFPLTLTLVDADVAERLAESTDLTIEVDSEGEPRLVPASKPEADEATKSNRPAAGKTGD